MLIYLNAFLMFWIISVTGMQKYKTELTYIEIRIFSQGYLVYKYVQQNVVNTSKILEIRMSTSKIFIAFYSIKRS